MKKKRWKLKNNAIVATVMSNLGMKSFARKQWYWFLLKQVGDRCTWKYVRMVII